MSYVDLYSITVSGRPPPKHQSNTRVTALQVNCRYTGQAMTHHRADSRPAGGHRSRKARSACAARDQHLRVAPPAVGTHPAGPRVPTREDGVRWLAEGQIDAVRDRS